MNSPLAIHLTRGAHDESELAGALAQLQAAGGPLPVAVYHVVETETPHASWIVPGDETGTQNPQLQAVFRLSSPLVGRETLAAEKPTVSIASRGIVVNGRCNLLLEGIKRAVTS